MRKPSFQINCRGDGRRAPIKAAGRGQNSLPGRGRGPRLPLAAGFLPAFAAFFFGAAGQAGAYIRHSPEGAAGAIFEKSLSPLSKGLPPLGFYSPEQPRPLFLLKSGGKTCALPLEQPLRDGSLPQLNGPPGFPAPPDFAFEKPPARPASLLELELSQDSLQLSDNFEHNFEKSVFRWQKIKLCHREIICAGRASCHSGQNKLAGLGGVMVGVGLIYFGGCIAAYEISDRVIAALCLPVWELLPYLPDIGAFQRLFE